MKDRKSEYKRKVIYIFSMIQTIFFSLIADRLPNGDKVKILNQFKYLVAIKSQFGIDRLLCGGAILDDFTILSAAHCFYNQVTRNFADKVIIRANTIENHKSMIGGIQRTLDSIYMLKSYVDGYDDDDIAIITVLKNERIIYLFFFLIWIICILLLITDFNEFISVI